MDRPRGSLVGRILPFVLAALVGIGAAWGWQRMSRGPRTAQKAPPPVPRIVPAENAAPAAAIAPPAAFEEAAPIAAEAPAPAPAAAAGPVPATGVTPPPGEKPLVDGDVAGASPEEAAPEATDVLPPGPKLRFREIWAYLMPGEMRRWTDAAPITDLCLFDFGLDPTGTLTGKANTAAIERASRRGIRTHLAVASSGNKTLLHLVLSPRYGVRKALIEALARLPRKHRANGLQLDFEGPREEEREDLVSFVRELRAALPPETLLSLAIPAKTSEGKSAYVYADLGAIADRLFIMVYDEHWQGGGAGAIADLPWHDRVLAFARSTLPAEKVVVGLPFYGRVWQIEKVARALNHAQVRELSEKVKAQVRRDPQKSHSFTYRTEVTGECWFEDAASLRAKLESARALGYTSVGFWRLGQEDPRVWDVLEKG
jgi:glycosyl hydrolase family 18 (putative chitinase)